MDNQQLEANRNSQFLQLSARIKRANERTAIFSCIDDFSKIPFDKMECYHAIQLMFLDKIHPSLFGQITDNEFRQLFESIFLTSPFSADSLLTLIQFIGTIRKEEFFKFDRLLQLMQLLQSKLVRRSLLSKDEVECSCEHFSFVLASFPDRLYSFLGRSSNYSASILASFEEDLLASLLQSMNQSTDVQGINIELLANILAEYNSISAEFINRFLTSILANIDQYEQFLGPIFTFTGVSRRKRESFLLTLIKIARNGTMLKTFFGNSVLFDQLLRKCLIGKAILIPSTNGSSLRNSKKVAEYFTIVDQQSGSELVSAFMELLQLFSDQCRIIELVTLHNQFQISIALFDFAREISVEMRIKMRDEVANLLLPLVPQILQQTDLSRRQIGMLLAETLFSLFQCSSALKFDYNNDDPILQEFNIIIKEKSKNGNDIALMREDPIEMERKRMIMERRRAPPNPRVAILLDSDDDDEVGGSLEEGGGKASTNDESSDDGQAGAGRNGVPFAYLRDCIDALRSEKENGRRWREALKAIPTMIRRRALGLDVLALELLEMAIFMENKFNASEFKMVRITILKLLLAYKPELVAHMARLYNSKMCSMAHRFLMLSAIVETAKFLYGMEEDGKEGRNMVDLAGDKRNEEVAPKEDEKKGPRVIWKSEKLNRASSMNGSVKGHGGFAAVAPQFAFPLLDLCISTRFEDKDFLLLGKMIWALGEVIGCSKNSPSILRISSATFSCLQMIMLNKRGENSFVLINTIGCYLAIVNGTDADLLREHFPGEMHGLWEWLENVKEKEKVDTNEALAQSIHFLSYRLSEIFMSYG